MQEIFKQLEFRSFSYEDDPEAIVDMHCCADVLEGSWFDKSETCKMHAKVVVRSPGSSWVVAYNSLIFAHADLIKTTSSDSTVVGWRIHENFRHPQVARLLLEGLSREAKKRDCTGLVIFADSSKVAEDLQMLGIQPDRSYRYANVSTVEKGRVLRSERVVLHTDEVANTDYRPFLGSPLPPHYILQRAFMGADYCVFRHCKPETFDIMVQDMVFLGCHDGREWHVFRKGEKKVTPDLIPSVLKTVASLKSGMIMLSERAMNEAGIVPINEGVFHDFYTSV